ncbi:MAG TPA: hypothetical protein VF490_21590 [Chryseosolibacter sp.]
MLLILLNWLVIFSVSFTLGFAARKLFVAPASNSEIAITVIWGLFIVSMISSLCLFFIPAGFFLLLMFFLVATLIQFFSREEIARRLNFFRITLGEKREVIFGSLLLLSLLWYSAQPSKMGDDGLYDTHTIMWFTQEGFVNGISNLSFPLGLGSSWHVLQALFSFNFLEGVRLNDLNGFLLFIFFIFCLENGLGEKQNLLVAFLLAIALPVCVPFLSAPSPDLPVLIFTSAGFYLISRPFGNRTTVDVLMLAAFAVSVKLSAVALALLGAVLIFHALVERVSVNPAIYLLLFLCAMTVVTKNIYQTGYPLYPSRWPAMADLSWATPPELFSADTRGLGSSPEVTDAGIGVIVKARLQSEGYKGIIDRFVLFSFPLIAFTLMWDVYQKLKAGVILQTQLFLHATFIVNFFIWLLVVPSFRFILPVYVFYVAWCLWRWSRPLNGKPFMAKIHVVPYVSVILLFISGVVLSTLNVTPAGAGAGEATALSVRTVLTPHVSYSFPGLDTLRAGATEYYHVVGNVYCWDTPVPCMPESYHRFLLDQGYEIFRTGRPGTPGFVLKKREGREGNMD